MSSGIRGAGRLRRRAAGPLPSPGVSIMRTLPQPIASPAAPGRPWPLRQAPPPLLKWAAAGLVLAPLVRARLLARPAPFAAVAPPASKEAAPLETFPLPADLP